MTTLDSILKSRDITDKGLSRQSYGFSSSHVCMWELDHKESWAGAFELWCWRRFSRVPWTARRSNQSILKKISPEDSLEGLMLKLKLPHFGYLMQRTDSLEKTLFWGKLKMGGEGDDRGWYGWMASPTQWTWVWVSSMSWQWTGKPVVLQSNGVTKRWTWLSNWTDTIWQMSWVRLTFTLANMSWTLLCHMLEIVCWMSSTGLLPLSSTHKQSRQ